MKKTNLFLVSFAIGFCSVLVGFVSTADAQIRIEPPAGATPACLERFNEVYEDGSISLDEAADLTNFCVDSDRTMISFYERLYDSLSPGGRPRFASMAEVEAAFRQCGPVTEYPCPPPDAETPRVRTSERRTLVLEARGPHHIEGRGNNRVVVCEDGTVPFSIEPYHARTEDGERHRWQRLVNVVIVYCLDPDNAAAPPIAEEEGHEDLDEVADTFYFAQYYCSPNLPEGVVRDAQWEGFCNTFDGFMTRLESFEGDLNDFRGQLTSLTTRMGDAEGMLREICRIEVTDAEWARMSRADKIAACREARTIYERDSVGSGNGWHLRFHLGLAFHGLGITAPAGILAPHGVVYAEIEALPVEHFGFFLRGYVGAGNLLDRIGQFNPDGTIGDEGIFGGSVGPTFRFNEMFALDVGLAASAVFNPGGQIGRSLHTWPVFQLGGEVRLRVNPLPWLHIEGTAGLDYTHAEVRRPNIDSFIGVDNVGYHLSLGLGVSF